MQERLTAGLVQLCAGPDPRQNLREMLALVAEAAAKGAEFILTPECCNFLSADADLAQATLRPEAQDESLRALQEAAQAHGVHLLIGSLALAEGARFVNRSFLLGPDGAIRARYDKIHMFDVTISATERYQESARYRAGDAACLAPAPWPLGMMICYDLRFPQLARTLAQAGAEILAYPAAFNDTTGAAHWQVLLRARAIETGAYVLAPAQCGAPYAGRRSYGHSLAVSPWGEVLAEAGDDPCVTLVELERTSVARARARIPSLTHDRDFTPPEALHG